MNRRNHRCYDSACPWCQARAEARQAERDEPLEGREAEGRENSYEAYLDRMGGSR